MRDWISGMRIKHLGLSYRLDPEHGAEIFVELVEMLRKEKLLHETNGPIHGLYFAGLPTAVSRVRSTLGDRVRVFIGDENTRETLDLLGVPSHLRPNDVIAAEAYESDRLAFGAALFDSDEPDRIAPFDRSGYAGFGTRSDTLVGRLNHASASGNTPLYRAHVGPYSPNRNACVKEFIEWSRQLASTGYLDILSIGSSQLTQERFGEDWVDTPNGGGVPIQTEDEYRLVYEASRPLLLRTYAGTDRIPELARIHERSINIAWHALSFWWFSQIDGRGPLDMLSNLQQHFRTLDFISSSGKPFEANVPHHFAFRGGDDVTYVVSGVISARAAKRAGIKTFVLQNMMNTPKSTSGLQDVAKARALLTLVRILESPDFRVIYQPRAGLDYFSPDVDKAKRQLAAVSAMMDDVEPHNPRSPEVIHVVSYSEAIELANPQIVDESIRITSAAVKNYRLARAQGHSPLTAHQDELAERTDALVRDATRVLAAVEEAIPNAYTPEGFYTAFWSGFLPVPNLWEGREEFSNALGWQSQTFRGSVRYVDEHGSPVALEDRLAFARENARRLLATKTGGDRVCVESLA